MALFIIYNNNFSTIIDRFIVISYANGLEYTCLVIDKSFYYEIIKITKG